jgi:hypothetical protein
MKDENEGRLSRAWRAVLHFVEALESNPVEDMHDRVARLEREIATLKAPDLRTGSRTDGSS